jgi:hypothetical protein
MENGSRMKTYNEKLEDFRQLLEKHQLEGLIQRKLDCESNRNNAKVWLVSGNKYSRVNVGDSGKYMVERSTEKIFGIKGYGVIHRGHEYGTLDTISEYDWSGYVATKK